MTYFNNNKLVINRTHVVQYESCEAGYDFGKTKWVKTFTCSNRLYPHTDSILHSYQTQSKWTGSPPLK